MQYDLGDIVLFDGGPALIIGRDTEERTYLIEFTGATGKRNKTVTDRDLDDAPTEWHVSNHLDLVHEVMALRKVNDAADEAYIIQEQARRILTHPSTRYEMNAAGYLERMELKLGGAIHILSPHVGLTSEIGEMLYSFFNELARQIEAEKSARK